MRVGGRRARRKRVRLPRRAVERAALVVALVRVRAEEVALRLDHVGRAARRRRAVKVGQRRGERGGGDARARGEADGVAEAALRLRDGQRDLAVEQEVWQRGVVFKGRCNVVEERGADDAPAAPEAGDGAQVQPPAVVGRRSREQRKALCVGADLGRVQRRLEDGERLGGIEQRRRFPQRPVEGVELAALGLAAADEPPLERRRDGRHGHAGVGRVLHRPLARALGPGLVDDAVDEVAARAVCEVVLLAEALCCDFEEVALEARLVPILKRGRNAVGVEAAALAEDVVGFGDELHVGVFDAVVDHLHVVARPTLADMADAGFAVGRSRGHGLDDWLDGGVALGRAAGHERGPVARADLAAGDAHTDKVEAVVRQQRLGAALRVAKLLVAAVDDDVAARHEGDEHREHLVHGLPRRDGEEDAAWLLERVDEERKVGKALNVHVDAGGGALGLCAVECGPDARGEFVRPVPRRHGQAARGHVQRQVLAHRAHAHDAKVAPG
mmetsp:Transcript_15297/g.51447  ORF Transcript_15297/g.51447 Transcript_15297/m.51447 type:complete len:499 (-) Transcript_15297:50-1546(-)